MRVLVRSTQFLLLASAVSLAACGGGGDDSPLLGVPSGNGNGGGGGGGNNQATPLLALGSGEGDNFQEGVITLTAPTISAGGRTTLRLNLVDKNNGYARYLTNTPVTITSNCVGNNRATITNDVTPSAPIASNAGVITALYEAKGCSGTDTITALLESGATATANLTITPPNLGGIRFHSNGSPSLSIAGAGTPTSPSETKVSFQVVDEHGNPAEGINVEFKLDTDQANQDNYEPQDRAELTITRVETDAQGIASTTLKAGRLNLVAKVLAYMTLTDGTEVFAESDAISINTNVPYASSFSLSAARHVVDAWNWDGITTQLTIRVADLTGNPVRDGTTVAFETDGGSVQPVCVISNGACSVNWTSQNPRPDRGLLTVTARTLGEQSFIDANQNKLYDDGETIFVDANRNGVFDAGEQVINDFFKGASCSYSARMAGHCQARVELAQSNRILMVDGTSIGITLTSNRLDPDGKIVLNGKNDGARICANIVDRHGHLAPPGTVINASTSVGSVDSGTPSSITLPEYDLATTMNPPPFCWFVKGAEQPAVGMFSVKVNVPAPSNVEVISQPMSIEIR